MDAYKMFSVYEGGPASDGFYYYTVKVRDGENTDNTYNFYFRVKVTDNPTKRDNSEEWKLIKGTGTLPVKFNYSYEKQSKDNDGNTVMETVNKSLEINGTIEFYDAPDKTCLLYTSIIMKRPQVDIMETGQQGRMIHIHIHIGIIMLLLSMLHLICMEC